MRACRDCGVALNDATQTRFLRRYLRCSACFSRHRRTYLDDWRKRTGWTYRPVNGRKLTPEAAARATDRVNARRARKCGVSCDRDLESVRRIYATAAKLREATGRAYHVDHITPMRLGGDHNESNLVILRADVNMAKGAADWPWLRWFLGEPVFDWEPYDA